MPTSRSSGWLLSIDPGLRCVGAALWKDGVLVHAGAVRGPPSPARGPSVWAELAGNVHADCTSEFVDMESGHLVVETMRYAHASKKGSAEDLLEVQGVAGAIIGRFVGWEAHEAPAHEWKGQVPRDVMAARTEAWLREQGWHARLTPSSRATETNDALHAVAIGRWWLRL